MKPRPKAPSIKRTPNPIDRHVGARVRMRRMLVNISQEKLAVACGITFQQIQKYEKGANRIGASRLQQIAGVLGVPASYFFEELPETGDGEKDVVTDFLQTKDGIRICKAMSKMSPAVRQKATALVEALVA